jgi:hypothetical protein
VYLQPLQGRFKLFSLGKRREASSFPIAEWNQTSDCFLPDIIESTFEVVDGISDDEGEVFGKVSILDSFKVALDEFASSVRVYMSATDQSFFQKVNTPLQVRNVMVGPFDLETCTFADRHS